MKKSFLFTVLFAVAVITGTVIFVKDTPPQKIYATSKVLCDVSAWPQKVIINGASYNCSLERGYCNSAEAAKGNAQCCASSSFGKDDCRDVKPGMTLYYELKTVPTGGSFYLGYDNSMAVNSIDARATPRQVWFRYLDREYEVDDAIKREGDIYNYNDNYNDIINMKVDSIFAGATSDYVNFRNIYVKKSVACDEKWACYDWSGCANGEQTRNCVELNECFFTPTSGPFTKKTCSGMRLMTDVYNRKTMQTGESWIIGGNYKLTVNAIDARIVPRQVWISLHDGKNKLDDEVIAQGGSYSYSDILTLKLDSVFAGATSDFAQFKDVYMKITSLGCVENWSSCGPWSECSSGRRSRVCVDSNNCGTVKNKPAVSISCDEPIPTSTPTPIPTQIPTLTSTPIPTPTITLIPSPANNITPTPTPTTIPTPISTPTPSPVITSTPVPTPANSLSPTSMPTNTPSSTPTPTRIPTVAPVSNQRLTPAPTSVPNPFSNYNSEEDIALKNIKEGAIIKAEGDIDVYIIKYIKSKRFKRLILSPSVFNNYGHLKWEDIITVNKSVLDLFITSDLVKAVDDEKIYRLYPAGDVGEKRWVKSVEIFEKMGFDWDEIYEINQFDRDSYITGNDLG